MAFRAGNAGAALRGGEVAPRTVLYNGMLAVHAGAGQNAGLHPPERSMAFRALAERIAALRLNDCVLPDGKGHEASILLQVAKQLRVSEADVCDGDGDRSPFWWHS